MSAFFEHLLIGLAWVVVITAGAYFGGPAVYHHIMDGEQAKVTVLAQKGALTADTTSANQQQKSCSEEIAAAGRAQAAIAAVARLQPVKGGQPQALITSDQIKAMTQ
jgi:hypothetical protein